MEPSRHIVRFRSLLGICGFFLSLWPQGADAMRAPFPDMERSWYRYKEAVAYLKIKDVISGYPDGTFQPKATINRAEFLKIVFKGENPIGVTEPCFTDVDPSAWYAPFICAAKRRGIVEGYSDGSYRPANDVNTAEAIKIALNAYGWNIEEGRGEKWYLPYTEVLDRENILPEHSYIPWENLTRERAADLLWRLTRFKDERAIPRLSEGCSKAEPAPPSSIIVNGIERHFLLTTPKNYVPHVPVPLIIAFHGRTNDNEEVHRYFRLDREITDAVIAYPAALARNDGTFSWSDPGNKPSELRDIALFDELVERLAKEYCIDMERIFVVGHSLGAWFANSLACVRGDVIRASATVGGDSVITDCAGPSAALIINNPHDRLSSFVGAERHRDQRVKENVCTMETQPTGSSSLHCSAHQTCLNGNEVIWCPHEKDTDDRGDYYPHHWPRETAGVIAEFFGSLR